jgi:outer membrane protein OmpA-like peptidoglycan-associated protein
MVYRKIVAGVLICMVAAPTLAAASREENIGVGVGATLGGIAGGPLGAMLGVAVGARLGEAFHFKQEEIERLAGDLRASTTQVADLEQALAGLESATHQLSIELQDAYANNHAEYLELLQAGIEMDLLFRTNEDVLSAGVKDRLAALAEVLAGLPAVNISIEGYADERGASDYNLALSERRAANVQDLLVYHGVDPARIFLKARGEVPAAMADPDGYALERRVSMKLFVGDAPALAANPL